MSGSSTATPPVDAPCGGECAPDLALRAVSGLGWVAAAAGGQKLLSLGIVMVLSWVLTPASIQLTGLQVIRQGSSDRFAHGC